MKMSCGHSGPCETCKNHYKGGCQLGGGYRSYDPATEEWIEMFRLRNVRQRVLHVESTEVLR